MKREGHIYALYCSVGFALFIYSGMKLLVLWKEVGMTSDVVVFAVVPVIFACISMLYFWLAVLFHRRAVARIHPADDGWKLQAASHSSFESFIAPSMHLRRRLGAQFESDESKARYAIFLAAGKHWVVGLDDFVSAQEAQR